MTHALNKGPANRSRLRFKHLRDYVRAIVDTVREPLLVLSEDFRIKMVNRSFCRTFRVSSQESCNQPLDNLGNGQWKIPKLRALLEAIVSKNCEIHDFEARVGSVHHAVTRGDLASALADLPRGAETV